MNVRTTPYGYQYENGVVIVNPSENNIIQQIFSDYLQGQSLLNIAEKLNVRRIEYRPGVVGWNKSRVMRLIEDERYIGTEIYPSIIDKEIYSEAVNLKLSKNTQQKTNRQDVIYNLDVPTYCPECGSIMKRKHRSVNNERWICSNEGCRITYSISDTMLLTRLTELLNQAIANPEVIQEVPTESEENIELLKLKNEINRTLDNTEFDKATLRSKMLEYTSLRYSSIDTNKYTTIKLKADFEKSSPLSEFSTELFRLTVKNIFFNSNGTVGITLLNGQQIGKE